MKRKAPYTLDPNNPDKVFYFHIDAHSSKHKFFNLIDYLLYRIMM